MIIGFKASAKKFFPCYSMTEMMNMEMEVVEIVDAVPYGKMYKVKSGRCIPADLCREISG